ncbi:MAG: hypothetical protein LBH39_00970 [Clostridiales Family XIII bacterium]|nr:hypothetical protein [Clostridiales Family XIII bacterium]
MGVEGILGILGIESPDDFGFFEYFADLAESRDDIPFEALHKFFSLVDHRALADLTGGYFEELLDCIPGDQIEFYTLMEAVGMNLCGLAERLAGGDGDTDGHDDDCDCGHGHGSAGSHDSGVHEHGSLDGHRHVGADSHGHGHAGGHDGGGHGHGGAGSNGAGFDKERGLLYYTEEFFKFRLWYLFDSKAVCRDTSDGTETEMPVAEAIVAHRLEKLGGRAYSYDFSGCMDYPLEEYIFPV